MNVFQNDLSMKLKKNIFKNLNNVELDILNRSFLSVVQIASAYLAVGRNRLEMTRIWSVSEQLMDTFLLVNGSLTYGSAGWTISYSGPI